MNMNQPQAPKTLIPDEPRLAKEKIMGGGRTEGVAEFEELKESLSQYMEALTTIGNFEMTKEWQNWRAYETQATSPQREAAKNAVKEKLVQIEKTVGIGTKNVQSALEFYRTEVENK